MKLDTLIGQVYASPRGPQVGAFFDYDGTVITGFSATTFYSHRLRNREMGVNELAQTIWAGVRGVETEADYLSLLDLSLQGWAGRSEEDLAKLGNQLFRNTLSAKLHIEVWDLVQAHHEMGHTVVLASSATRFQVEPMAKALGAEHVLCTELETVDGVLTGRVSGRPLWSAGKSDAVVGLAAAEGIDLTESFAYSNGAEDVPFLASVGNPVAVEPDAGLTGEAADRGWPVLRCVPRGGPPGLATLARTAGFYGAFGAAFGAGLGLGALNRSREQVFEIAGGVGADVGLALAGIDVGVVQGEEYLWSDRPCVFVFNHQSKIDPIIVMKLLRKGFTGVAKKEAKKIPGFGQLFQIAGVAFVDRGNTGQAKQALAPAVDKLRNEGISLAMSPEGTRSPTPKLGAFKKGAFHIAMQAGVPIVPIVLRGAGEVMWRGSQTLRPGVVEVVVLPPVPTDTWSVATIEEHVAVVRDQFLHTLGHWPGHPVAPLALRAATPREGTS